MKYKFDIKKLRKKEDQKIKIDTRLITIII